VDFSEFMEWVTKVFEAAGVAIIAIGGATALITAAIQRAQRRKGYYEEARRRFGRPLLLGLEVLVAADIIETVTVDSSLESVGVLALLVLVRTVLSVALDIELYGVLPWRKAAFELKQAEAGREADE
jgi:uncharacterized membrane protein